MPPAQAISYVLTKGIDALKWLKELQDAWKVTQEEGEDGSDIRMKQGIVVDALCVYLAALFDTRSGTHSLSNSYESHKFIEDFRKHQIVKECLMHRHNRAGHQSEKYGFVASLDSILSSDLDAWMQEAFYAVCAGKFTVKVDTPVSPVE